MRTETAGGEESGSFEKIRIQYRMGFSDRITRSRSAQIRLIYRRAGFMSVVIGRLRFVRVNLASPAAL